MNSELEQLAHKIQRLAELAQTLRNENNALRRDAIGLTARNQELQQRMQEAHARVAALLAQMPEQEEIDEELA